MKVRGMKERIVVGLVWEGTYQEASRGDIHQIIEAAKTRMDEIKYKTNESELIGISIHDRRGGFIHYVGWEVDSCEEIPHGMTSNVLPEGMYLISRHKQEKKMETTYEEIKQAIQDKKLTPLKPEEVDAYDPLPIKVELHSLETVLKGEKEFEIHIPVIK
ncbi:GyrI-like domain-containing protein [Salipaludibacillus daqingensis]|uniref:GyrI-like domain-containing protein n=1 Tax=Salipaludibacillus daqingensis TaxID=3041001 RepID=UPI002474046B|nr:GyrI-like domain-containing protein [Salipaludibacillus daqingensis]